MKTRRWIWITLFIAVLAVMVSLATGWNVVLWRDYRKMLELAGSINVPPALPWIAITLGSLGFCAAVGTLVLFFVRLLREMQLTQLQSEFIATVSHELKTPIAAVELSATLIRAGNISEDEIRRLWESHDQELKRLHRQVEALLEAARLQIGTKPVSRTPVSVETWLNQSLARWRNLLGPNAAILREGTPLEAEALLDPHALDLIVDNLLDNARKFSRGSPRVTVRTERLAGGLLSRHGRWRICFEDQGWGFDPNEAKRIFGRFSRAKTLAPYAIPGTGLGLYLAASASRAMGLSLRGESPGKGRGAIFTLEGVFAS